MAKKSNSINTIGVVAIEASQEAGRKGAKAQDPEAIRKAVLEAVKTIPASDLKKLKNGRITVLV